MHDDLPTRDLAVLWHPCSQMRDYRDFPPLPVVGARGMTIELADGRRLLDPIGSWWCKTLGHGHPRLVAAAREQLDRFDQVILANTTYDGVVRLCERLLAAANAGSRRYGKVFLADNGSTAVEIALKMALQAQAQRGKPGRTRFASLEAGYHGETVGALSVGDCSLYTEAYRPLLFDCTRLGPLPLRSGGDDPRWHDAGDEWPAIEAALAPVADQLAAVVYEPVLQGAGGMRLYSPDLLVRLRRWADEHDVYLIADEIAAGMGRLGTILASHLVDDGPAAALPDFACVSKGLTGGMLPLSAVLVGDAIYELFDADYHERRAFMHSNTWTGNAVAVAIANAVFDVLDDGEVLAGVARREVWMREAFAALAAEGLPLHRVRACGAFAAADLHDGSGGDLPARRRTGYAVYRAAVDRGALLRPLGDTVYLMPPLDAAKEDLDAVFAIMREAIREVVGCRL